MVDYRLGACFKMTVCVYLSVCVVVEITFCLEAGDMQRCTRLIAFVITLDGYLGDPHMLSSTHQEMVRDDCQQSHSARRIKFLAEGCESSLDVAEYLTMSQ